MPKMLSHLQYPARYRLSAAADFRRSHRAFAAGSAMTMIPKRVFPNFKPALVHALNVSGLEGFFQPGHSIPQ